MSQKPGLPEGVRDFGPIEVRNRQYLFDIIRRVFQLYGYQPLETPAMEKLSTLTGKYGEEGDRLLFKILNNGDFLSKANKEALEAQNSAKLVASIADRGLRYDLTVPFARYVVMQQGKLPLPFKRYQIQAVWRADRPQKGRYREFTQCDVDVIGSAALTYEAELMQIYDTVFATLKLPVKILINHRSILEGMAEAAMCSSQFQDMTVAIDKIDKIGITGVKKELFDRGFSEFSVQKIETLLELITLEQWRPILMETKQGKIGLQELDSVLAYLSPYNFKNELVFDATLARGLSYYTGCIFEVKATDLEMGSLGGGGRYADLTGVFGLPGLSGVGLSFGADRIIDCLAASDLFPKTLQSDLQILLLAFDAPAHAFAFEVVTQLRQAGIRADLYPEPSKIQKQMKYAHERGAAHVGLIGSEELAAGVVMLKNMDSGQQEKLNLSELIARLQ